MARSSSSETLEAPELSVVLACPDGRAPDDALGALRRGTEGVSTELLVAAPPDRPSPCPAEADGSPRPRRVQGPAEALVPELWGAGLRAARGSAVAFTTTRFRVGEGWGRALVDALAEGAAGAGGPIRLGAGAGFRCRAVHLLRYADFGPGRAAGPVEEIPADNAAYWRTALDRAGGSGEEGFWDVEVHRRLRSDGGELAWVPRAEAKMVDSAALPAFLLQRFRHGRRYGRYRARELETPVWRSLAAAPLVPVVLTVRALRRHGRRALAASLPAVPHLLLMAAAWAAGEARGAWDVAGGGDRDQEGA